MFSTYHTTWFVLGKNGKVQHLTVLPHPANSNLDRAFEYAHAAVCKAVARFRSSRIIHVQVYHIRDGKIVNTARMIEWLTADLVSLRTTKPADCFVCGNTTEAFQAIQVPKPNLKMSVVPAA